MILNVVDMRNTFPCTIEGRPVRDANGDWWLENEAGTKKLALLGLPMEDRLKHEGSLVRVDSDLDLDNMHLDVYSVEVLL